MKKEISQRQLHDYVEQRLKTEKTELFIKEPTAFVSTSDIQKLPEDVFTAIMVAAGAVDKANYSKVGKLVAFQLQDGKPDIYFPTIGMGHMVVDHNWGSQNPEANTVQALKMFNVPVELAAFYTKVGTVEMLNMGDDFTDVVFKHDGWEQHPGANWWLVVNRPEKKYHAVAPTASGLPINYSRA